jgi:uroporphyrinogen decarboxylase
MTPRERILEALDHRLPDRLPVDFGAMRSTGIAASAYCRLRRQLGLEEGLPRLYDVGQQLAEPELPVLARLGGDVVQAHRLCPCYGIRIDAWKGGRAIDGSPVLVPAGYNPAPGRDGDRELLQGNVVVARMPRGGFYFHRVWHPLEQARTASDIDALPLEEVSLEEVGFIAAEVRRLRGAGDRAILLAFGGSMLESGQDAWGFERFMAALAAEPDLVHHYLERITARNLRGLDRILDAVGAEVDIIQFGDDLGMQDRPQISTRMYRALIKPYHQRQFQHVRQRFPHLRVFFHSCGSIRPLIPDLIEAGVQILNPVQISAHGMDPLELKREFGKELVFWGGGADMQHTVPFGSLEEIRAQVRELVSIFAPGGGFVFAPVHNIQPDIPPEKIIAIYDEARAAGLARGGAML